MSMSFRYEARYYGREYSILDACHYLINFKTRLLTYCGSFWNVSSIATGLTMCNYNRFGHLFVSPKDQISGATPRPVTTHLLKGPTFNGRRQFVTRYIISAYIYINYYKLLINNRLVSHCDIEALKQEHCEVIVDPDVTTYKIRFTQYGEDLDAYGGEFCGICYIEEKAGSFTLLSVHNGNDEIIGVKIDIIRPGRYTYILSRLTHRV